MKIRYGKTMGKEFAIEVWALKNLYTFVFRKKTRFLFQIKSYNLLNIYFWKFNFYID